MGQSLEELAQGIDPKSLPSASFDMREEIPEVSGVYFFVCSQSKSEEVSLASRSIPGACVLYVGKSDTNIMARWRHDSHTPSVLLRRKRQEIQNLIDIHWLEETTDNVTPLETALIRRFDPPLNNQPPEAGRLLNRILGLDENDGLVGVDPDVDDLRARILRNADERAEGVRKCWEAADGTRDSPFGPSPRSEARNNAFRMAYALSLENVDEETTRRFPEVVSIRKRIEASGAEAGTGYDGQNQMKKLAGEIGLSNVGWQTHAFSESSTRFAVFEQQNGKLKLYADGSIWERK